MGMESIYMYIWGINNNNNKEDNTEDCWKITQKTARRPPEDNTEDHQKITQKTTRR